MQNIIIAILLVGLGVLAASWFLKRRREETWHNWARSKGFTYLGPPRGPMIIGSVNQRTFEVSTSPHGSDTEGGVEIVRVSIELNGLEKHRAEGAQGVIGDLAKIGEETTQTGDQDFDRDVMIHAESEADVIEYWTTERKNVFLNLISDPDLEVITLEGSELFTEYRSVIPNSDQLEHAMNQLASAAERLDLSASLNE